MDPSKFRSSNIYHKDGYLYIRKEYKNGRWRYYYDNDKKPDKGFSIKKFNRQQTNYDFDDRSLIRSRSQDQGTVQSINGVGVNSDIYTHSDALLYFRNEPVKDIIKYRKSQIDKGLKYVSKRIGLSASKLSKFAQKFKKKKTKIKKGQVVTNYTPSSMG